ncbi:polysaccharide biosynthesis/export family protein [Flavobacterium kingsejongi]|uniref:Sugar transporter n=1 Tax=Flavobacterium kingsejongi TaxID=1678728 RepID=A0A2S1LP17_9FLAO|nr:polysaccharide biosynthesis/export family protein [Flavobacterium kingsejongi]AWG25376.1 sugar transporter [Flavobacterium kingsejongi]
MNLKRIKFFFQLFLFVLILNSCTSKKNVVYYQDIDKLAPNDSNTFEQKIQPDDLLMIVVMGENPEVVAPFNLPNFTLQSVTEMENVQPRINTYLVDIKGKIQFPVLGEIELGGLTITEAIKKMNTILSGYIVKPSVNFRRLNFKVTVSGEVTQPKTHTITTDRVTLIEALSMSGDLTIYGRRDNILVIREENGKKMHARIDMTKSDFINSPFYYLSQNDVVYVEPNKTRVNSAGVGPNTSIIISAISLLVTVIALTIR